MPAPKQWRESLQSGDEALAMDQDEAMVVRMERTGDTLAGVRDGALVGLWDVSGAWIMRDSEGGLVRPRLALYPRDADIGKRALSL